MEEIEQKKNWELRFALLSDSILYNSGYSREEIEIMNDTEKLGILQSLDTLTEC